MEKNNNHIEASRTEIAENPCLLMACNAPPLSRGMGRCPARAGEVCIDRLDGGRHRTGPHVEREAAWKNATELERVMLKIKWEDAQRGQK